MARESAAEVIVILKELCISLYRQDEGDAKWMVCLSSMQISGLQYTCIHCCSVTTLSLIKLAFLQSTPKIQIDLK